MVIINKIKGTLDFYNLKYKILKNIINNIKKILKFYGYIPIKTPSIENTKILQLKKINLESKNIYFINKTKFLIYDLTIPLIRFLNNNYNNIIFPFKRYQLQKVWRGENPQYNRYREFYQLDVDIITLKKDKKDFEVLELITLCEKIFLKLKLKVIFNFNNINILFGICKILKIKKDKIREFLIIIDKINKFKFKKIFKLIINKKILKKKNYKQFIFLYNINKIKNNKKKILILKYIFKKNKINLKGIINIVNIYKRILNIRFKNLKFKINFLLSRGLNYYNNIIFEINTNTNKTSILGGGRYDNFLKLNKKKTYYIGMSLGIYRIYNILINKKQINIKDRAKILLINLNLEYNIYNKYQNFLIQYNYITEIYPYYDKIKKQIKYALKKKIKFLIFIGKKEIYKNIIKIKNLNNKKEYKFSNKKELISFLKKNYK